jgi:hypothetical protein
VIHYNKYERLSIEAMAGRQAGIQEKSGRK